MVEVAGQHPVAALAEPERDLDLDLRLLHVGGDLGFVVGRIARALVATRMSPNQIDSLSRSAGSPALPTAMTTRPQLASSPAIAVFTSGELAIDSAIRRADLSTSAPSTMHFDQLARAFAVAHDLLGEVGQHGLQRLR